MDQCKNMESDVGYGFLARVPIDGSDEQASAAQRGALAPIEQGWMLRSRPRSAWRRWKERAK